MTVTIGIQPNTANLNKIKKDLNAEKVELEKTEKIVERNFDFIKITFSEDTEYAEE